MLVKLLIYSQTSTAGPLKVENGWIILSHNLLGTWLLVHAVIKVNQLHWRGGGGGGGGGALEGEYHQPHTDHSSFQIIGFVE